MIHAPSKWRRSYSILLTLFLFNASNSFANKSMDIDSSIIQKSVSIDFPKKVDLPTINNIDVGAIPTDVITAIRSAPYNPGELKPVLGTTIVNTQILKVDELVFEPGGSLYIQNSNGAFPWRAIVTKKLVFNNPNELASISAYLIPPKKHQWRVSGQDGCFENPCFSKTHGGSKCIWIPKRKIASDGRRGADGISRQNSGNLFGGEHCGSISENTVKGLNGLNTETIYIIVGETLNEKGTPLPNASKFFLDFRGQDGQEGPNGEPGLNGQDGQNGGNGQRDNAGLCKKRPGKGGDGGNGGSGGIGGNGGDGGNGAKLYVISQQKELDNVTFSKLLVKGGVGATRGNNGSPGRGGKKGSNGSKPGGCGGAPGSVRRDGADGVLRENTSVNGKNGHDGTVFKVFTDKAWIESLYH